MILALLGAGLTAAFAALLNTAEGLLPADAWESALAIGAPLMYLVPPTFASSAPLALTAFAAIGLGKLLFNLLGRR